MQPVEGFHVASVHSIVELFAMQFFSVHTIKTIGNTDHSIAVNKNSILILGKRQLPMSAGKDPYDWAKERISYLIGQIAPLKNDSCAVSPGQIWSIKKLLTLDYYIASTHAIFKKHFENYYFVDTHCGSGLIGFSDDLLRDVKFPGSPLIATLRNKNKPFSDYIMSDISEDSIKILEERLLKIKDSVGDKIYSPKVRSFSETAQLVKDKDSGWGNAFLIFIDPTGYTDLQWTDIEKLLSIEKADIFINFMSYSVALNRPHAERDNERAKTFDSVFGTIDWRKCKDQNDLIELYMSQIRTKKQVVEKISVYKAGENQLYTLIFASNNPKGAGNVMTYIKGIVDSVTTELIRDALKVAANKQKDLNQWF